MILEKALIRFLIHVLNIQSYIIDVEVFQGILSIMAGAESFEEIEDFGKTHESWLKYGTVNKINFMLNPCG